MYKRQIDEHKNNTDIRISEIENTCKTEIQALNESVNVITKNSIQSECINDKKLYSIEQSISSVKDELSLAINQKLNNITEYYRSSDYTRCK